MHGYHWFNVLDLEVGYYQVKVHSDSRRFFAFRTPWGKYQFWRMPMGASNSPFSFQGVMEHVLSDLIGNGVHVFQDDVLIYSVDIGSHFRLLAQVLDKFISYNIKVKTKKCNLFQKKVKFLGHIISEKELLPDPERVESILNFDPPHTVTGVREFLGKVNFYAKFVPRVSELALPLTKLLSKMKGKIEWGQVEQASMDEIKQALASEPILKLPDYSKDFILTTCHSDTTIASILEQCHNDVLFPVAYYSRKLKTSEQNYSRVEKAALAVVASLDHFRSIVYGYPIEIRTEAQAMEFILGIRDGNSRLSSWSTKILKYIPYLKCVERNHKSWARILCIEDGEKSRNPSGDSQIIDEMIENCVNATSMKNDGPVVYTDGCCIRNGKEGSSSGIGVYWDHCSHLNVSCSIPGRSTNNRSEILAVCLAVTSAIAMGYKAINVVTDSKYVINCFTKHLAKWIECDWHTAKGKEIVNEAEYVLLHRLSSLITINLSHVSAHKGIVHNEGANQLAFEGATGESTASLDKFIDILVDQQHKPIISIPIVTSQPDSATDVTSFSMLSRYQGEDPELVKMAGEIACDPPSVSKDGIQTYRHANGLIYARGIIKVGGKVNCDVDAPYVPTVIRHDILSRYHDDKWSCHPGYVQFCTNLLRNYFWSSFRDDVASYIKSCELCQKNNPGRGKAPVQEFNRPTHPFQIVSLDIVGPLKKTKCGHSYILNIIDMFSRYLISVPLVDQRTQTVLRAIEVGLISRFGCPSYILTDRGSNFQSELFHKVLSMFHIRHRTTGPYRPQTNGLVERVNRTVKEKLTHLSTQTQDVWDDHIHLVQFAHNNSIHGTLGKSPNELILGKILNLPTNFINREPILELKPDAAGYFMNLQNKLNTVFQEVYAHEIKVQQKRMLSINKGRRLREFKENDLVLYKDPVRNKNTRKGFQYKYRGPFRIIKRVSEVSYDLMSTFKGSNNRIIRAHIDRLKNYNSRNDDRQGQGCHFLKPPVINKRAQSGSKQNELDGSDFQNFPRWQGKRVVDRRAAQPVGKQRTQNATPIEIPPPTTRDETVRAQHDGYLTRSKGYVSDDIFHKYQFQRGNILPH